MSVFNVLESLAKNRVVFACAVIVTMIVTIVIMVVITPQLNVLSASLPILDTRFTYTYEDVELLFTTLGASGRELYGVLHLWDSIYPAAYGLLFAMFIARLGMRTRDIFERIRWCEMLPIVAAFMDYAENIAIQTQIASYPMLSVQIIACASVFTMFKWALLATSLLVIFLLLVVNLMRHGKTRSSLSA